MALDLRYVSEGCLESGKDESPPRIEFGYLDLRKQGHLGLSAYAEFDLTEGQAVTFILRTPPSHDEEEEQQEPAPVPSKAQAIKAGIPYDGESSDV